MAKGTVTRRSTATKGRLHPPLGTAAATSEAELRDEGVSKYAYAMEFGKEECLILARGLNSNIVGLMQKSSAGSFAGRVPFWLWALTYLPGAGFMYLLWRLAYCPAVMTTGEHAFLIGYALLGTLLFFVAARYMEAVRSRLPKWLSSFWSRMGIYLTIFMALDLGLRAMQLPKFYENLLGHTVFIFALPFVLGQTKRRNQVLPGRNLSAPYPVQTGEEITLRRSRPEATHLLIAPVILILLSFFLITKYTVIAWILMGIFGLVFVCGLLMLIPGNSYLILKRDGFVMVAFWRRFAVRWHDIKDLEVIEGPGQQQFIGYNFSEDSPLKIKASGLMRDMYGKDSALGASYGIPAEELCAMMIQHKAMAGS